MGIVKQKEILKQVMPDIFLKKVLSYPYEHIGYSYVFNLEDALDVEQIQACEKVLICDSVDALRTGMESDETVNLYISKNLINRVLLEEILTASSQSKNILWGIV
ncbi:MAG: hypothetical protein IJX20_03540 [Alphaproteobacteria bacterium]|nr:hypothetical protein [Alphaproteobacteria bacterium]